MRANRARRRVARGRAVALVLGAATATACTTTATSTEYRALTEEWERSTAPAATGSATRPDAWLRSARFLERDALVREVLQRNPTIRAARYAWRAAIERYPQMTSLDDPMMDMGAAPRTFGSDRVESAPKLDLRQKFPFPGKLELRGEVALAEAEVAAQDFEAVRLRLATMASLVFDDYYLATRSRAINAEHIALLREFQRIAAARYEAGQAQQVDPIQAEVQLTHALHREVIFETQIRVAAQQLNALLRRRPEEPLPPPPLQLTLPERQDRNAGAGELVEEALGARPELQGAQAQIRASRAAADLARREYFPDVTLVTAYNRQWQESDLRPWVGMQINLPIRLERRRAALQQAEAELERAQSERTAMEHEVRRSVQTAVERLNEAVHVLELFRSRLLPAARDQVAAARSGFESGKSSFLVLIDASRNLLDVQLGLEEARADVDRRWTELSRALGRIPGLEPSRTTR